MNTIFKYILKKIKHFIRKRYLNKLYNSLDALPEFTALTLIDVGAAGDIEPRWKDIAKYINYIGFEPDERSRKKLNQTKSVCKKYKILPNIIWEKNQELNFNLCKKPLISSAYLPNYELIKKFPNAERFEIIDTQNYNVTKLDDIEIGPIDFIKLDIQGGELSALKGSEASLKKVFGLEIEVEFLEIYKSQPLFGDICSWLSNKGFDFIDFVSLVRWERSAYNEHGQCFFGDALFLKSPEKIKISKMSLNQISSYLFILLIYRRFDMIESSINLLSKEQKGLYESFINRLTKIQKINKRARNINSISSLLIGTLGSEYRSHLLY